METKHILALLLFAAVGCGSILATTFSQRLRDLAFFGMVCFSIYAEKFDVNFFGQYWYRGTSRGVGISMTDVLAFAILISSLIAPRYPRRPGFVPASLGVLALYFAYCVYMTLNALEPLYAVWELANIPRGVLILLAGAAYLRTQRELGILIVGLSFTVCVEAVYALKQRYLGGMYRVPGTLDHANSLSMYVCMISPVLVAAAMANWSKWLRLIAGVGAVAATVSVLLTISRAGLPIYAFVVGGTGLACMSWRITFKKVLGAFAIAAVCGVVFVKMWDQIKARYMEASFHEEYLDEQSEGRGVYIRWARAILNDHPTGVGLNNWSYAVSKTYGPASGFWYEDYDDIKTDPEKADLPSIRYAAPAHSLAALTAGELGIPGLVIFGLVWFRWFLMGAGFLVRRLNEDATHRLGIGFLFATCGIFLQSVTEWVYRQSTLFLMFHLMIGGLASLRWLRLQAKKAPAETDAVAEDIEVEVSPVPASAGANRR
jgi:hypothetical protein